MSSTRVREFLDSEGCCALIFAGSDSDQPHIELLVKHLTHYQIPHIVRICSAHKQPLQLMSLIEEFNQIDGSIAYISVAGGTDALSGLLSYHAIAPVISCPPDKLNPSCLTNPGGSCNATILKPINVARFLAQIFATSNSKYRGILKSEIEKKVQHLRDADQRFLASS